MCIYVYLVYMMEDNIVPTFNLIVLGVCNFKIYIMSSMDIELFFLIAYISIYMYIWDTFLFIFIMAKVDHLDKN